MGRLFFAVAVIGFVAIGFWGCKSSSEPSDDGNMLVYYPLNIGNWWKYRSVEVDSTGIEYPETADIDSVVVVGSVQIKGKQAAVVESYYDLKDYSMPVEPDTSYLYVDANSIWTYWEKVNLGFDGATTEVQIGWIKIADFRVDRWEILELDVNDTVDLQQGAQLIFESVKMTGRNFGKQVVTVSGQAYQAIFIKTIIEIKMVVDLGSSQQNVTATIVQRTWYAQGIGPIKYELRGVFPISFLDGHLEWRRGGKNRELIGYYITL